MSRNPGRKLRFLRRWPTATDETGQKGEAMKKYRVVWTVTEVEEEFVDAESMDDAQNKWEEMGVDGELFFIEDEDGNQMIYD